MREQSTPEVGSHVRAFRQRRGLSLRTLAGLCDLSPNTISLIERGTTSPSVATLHRLATALEVSIISLFQGQEDAAEVVLTRAGARPHSGSATVQLESLGAGLENQTIGPFVVTLEPGAASGQQGIIHTGHELVYCLEGEVEYQVADKRYHLVQGDSLLFEARIAHRWSNPCRSVARFLLVFQEATGGLSVVDHLRG